MPAATHPQGVDLLDRVLGTAAARARAVLGEHVALCRCHDIELRDELDETVFEASCVRQSDDGLTIAVFASGRDPAGCERMVAAGRFTFSTFTRPSASIAAEQGI